MSSSGSFIDPGQGQGQSSLESRPRQVIHTQDGGLLNEKPAKLTKQYKETVTPQGKGALIGGLIMKWPNHDVWPFRFGIPVLGALGAGTAGFLNHTFRDALALDYRLRLSSYLGLMVVSGLSSAVWHMMLVATPIVENKGKQCPICLQVRAAALQVVNGIGYPFVLAPVFSYVVASSFKARHLPKIYSRPGDVIKYTRSVYKPIQGTLGLIMMAQVILSMGVTYFEQEVFYSKVLPVVEGRETFAKKPEELLS